MDSLEADLAFVRTAERDAASESIDGAPSWALRFAGGGPELQEETADGMLTTVVGKDAASLCSIRVPHAEELDEGGFRQATLSAYRAIKQILNERPDQRPMRMWNFIPGILDPLGKLPHRYMAFNAGRLDGFTEWQYGANDLSKWVPTSSGVGNSSSDLVVHALSCDQPGIPVENRRQVSSYRYSERYGPRPPCFSRALRLERNGRGSTLLMLGGTASVVGEDTLHPEDLSAQIDETLRNLEVLIQEGLPERSGVSAAESALGLVRQMRVYYVRREDLPTIARAVNTRFPGLRQPEFTRTVLCRAGLVVELEGVASQRAVPDFWPGQEWPELSAKT